MKINICFLWKKKCLSPQEMCDLRYPRHTKWMTIAKVNCNSLEHPSTFPSCFYFLNKQPYRCILQSASSSDNREHNWESRWNQNKVKKTDLQVDGSWLSDRPPWHLTNARVILLRCWKQPGRRGSTCCLETRSVQRIAHFVIWCAASVATTHPLLMPLCGLLEKENANI